MRGNLVSHSKQRTKRLFRPNLHSFKIMENGILKKVRLCTTCIKMEKKRTKVKNERLLVEQERIRLLNKSLKPKTEESEKNIVHEKIPEEVRLEMKVKSKKEKLNKSEGRDLVEEILAQGQIKEDKKKRVKK